MPFDDQRVLSSPTGATLKLYVKEAAQMPRGAVQINHGLAEHAGRYERFADFLSGRGFAVYAHDHRGHGGTRAPDAPPGVFAAKDGADKVVADVAAVHDLIAARHPGLPVVVFGHSMGGLVALEFVLQDPERARAAAIWNADPSAGVAGRLAQALLAWERFRLGSDMPSRALPALTFRKWAREIAASRTEFDWLSRDAAEVDAYIADPLCGWDASVSLWRDILDLTFRCADDRQLSVVPRSLPFNFVGGAEDPVTGKGRAVTALATRMRRIGFSNVASRIYPETRHESLNELNRDQVMADFGRWLDRVIQG